MPTLHKPKPDAFPATPAAGTRQTGDKERVPDDLKPGNFSPDRHLREQEGYHVAATLELAAGNVSEAARLPGINRTALHSRMDAHEKLDR